MQVGSSVSKPHFLHNNNRVIVFYDSPHLLKNKLNNLKKSSFKVGENNVLWQLIVSFYCSNSVLPIRMAPKLTQKHVDLPVFSGRVKGWTQGQPWCHTIPYCLLTDHGRPDCVQK